MSDNRPAVAASVIAVTAVLALIAVCSALSWLARIYIVEPEAVAAACLAGQGGWQCVLREYLVLGFTRNSFGVAALIIGVLATVSRWRVLAIVAIACGAMGAVLYRYELSGVGLLLGALVLLRRPPRDMRQDDAGGQQSAQPGP